WQQGPYESNLAAVDSGVESPQGTGAASSHRLAGRKTFRQGSLLSPEYPWRRVDQRRGEEEEGGGCGAASRARQEEKARHATDRPVSARQYCVFLVRSG